MFDDLNNKNEEQKKETGKKELDDIFAETDESQKPKAFQAKEVSAPEASKETIPPKKNSMMHKVLIPILIIVVVVHVIGGGIWAYYKFVGSINLPFLNSKVETQNSASNEDDVPSKDVAPPENDLLDNTTETNKADINKVDIPPEIIDKTDTDKDGLSDQEEIQFGTDINNVDSDNDGLFDQEEVKVYKTDPLNPDTDGDGFLDGDEVKDGFDPLGEGKLYEL
ncbi:MAG: hypothetical protein U9Q85_02095 [Patescibacteria group bacterium]|nr:hypothetical protein [Patescibacteria group bacterium]